MLVIRLFQGPDITCINKDGSVEDTYNGEPKFKIGFKFYIAGLARNYKICIPFCVAGTNCTRLPAPKAPPLKNCFSKGRLMEFP